MSKSPAERLSAIGARYLVDEDLAFGLDVGIASTGSAAVRLAEEPLIAFLGSRCFEAPEDPKTKELKNKTRRDKRLLRRVTRRRARRMADVRKRLVEAGLLASGEPAGFHNRKGAPDPWQARAQGLDRRLDDAELAAALLHIAKHRGFRSSRKSEGGENAPADDKKMLGAIQANKERLARYRSVGEMVVKDEAFRAHKRNKGGEYSHTHARDDLLAEARRLLAAQRSLGNAKIADAFEERYLAITARQLPLQDSEAMVGACPFEPDQKRAPRHAPSFEKFRFLAKLNTIKVIRSDGRLERLTREELARAAAGFGIDAKSVTWNALAKKVGLPSGTSFAGIDEKKAKTDLASSGGCAAGTKTLYDAVGPAGWNALRDDPALLDQIAAVIAFREEIGSIEEGLQQLASLEPAIRKALMAAVRAGSFSGFKRAGHISAKAARRITPYLLERMVYSEACQAADYDHGAARRIAIDDIKNPVVQRSLLEAVKQVETLVHHFGARPGRIVVELARNVGKSAEERDKITKGIEKRTAEKERHRRQMKDCLGMAGEPSEEDLRRYELWKEQNYRCLYSDEEIPAPEVLASSNRVQVDHVLPRSRSQDNSYVNQVLCFAKENQNKGKRTPWEWKGESDPGWWQRYEARVRALKLKGRKQRTLLMRDFDERQQGFVERNLNDTKYAARALLTVLRDLYRDREEPDPASEGYLGSETRRLFARPGTITAILRRAWGLDGLKDRADDRHHGLDALICAAAANEWLLHRLTRQYQRVEEENRGKWTPWVPPPWDGFREAACAHYETLFVARSEKRRGRGQGHNDTIYRVGTEEGRKAVYERKAVADLTGRDLERLKDATGGNKPLAEALTAWIDKGKPADDPPRSAKGDVVRKVFLAPKGKTRSGFELNGGHVDNADMVRVDVFARPDKKGRDIFYLVPIYRRQVMDRKRWPQPPNRAMVAHKPEADWTVIDDTFTFRFSLYPDSYVELVQRDGAVTEGYYRSCDRDTAGIILSPHNDRLSRPPKRGVKTLLSFCKFQVDRLGAKHEIESEIRTWHGAACT